MEGDGSGDSGDVVVVWWWWWWWLLSLVIFVLAVVTGAGWDLGGDAPVVPRENLRKIRKSNSESPVIL